MAQVLSGGNPTMPGGMEVPGMSQEAMLEMQKKAAAAGMGAPGAVAGGAPGMTQMPQMPADMPQMPGGAPGQSGMPQMPAGMPQMPQGMPQMPTGMSGAPGQPGMPQMPAGMPQMPAGMPQIPAGMQQIPAGMQQMPAGMPQMPAGAPGQPGMPQMPAGMSQMPAGMPVQPGMPQMLQGMPQVPGGALGQPGMSQMPQGMGGMTQMVAAQPQMMAAPGAAMMAQAPMMAQAQAVPITPQMNMASAAPVVNAAAPNQMPGGPGDHRYEPNKDFCACCWDPVEPPPPPAAAAPKIPTVPAVPAAPVVPAIPAAPVAPAPATRAVELVNTMDSVQPSIPQPTIPANMPEIKSEPQQIEQKVAEEANKTIEAVPAAPIADAQKAMSQEQPSWKKNIHDEEFKREAPQPALWKKNCDPDHESFGFTQAYGEEAGEIVKKMLKRHRMVDPYKHPAKSFGVVWEEQWVVEEPSRDPYGESMIKELASVMRKTNEQRKAQGIDTILFVDPHFPPEERSLYADPATSGANADAGQTFRKDQDPFLAGVKGIEWKRPKDVCNPADEPVVFSGDISPDDVAQGKLGNCYFLAAISSCGVGDSDVLIHDLIVEEGADVGLYGVKFYLHGKWVTVIVDDLIPCTWNGRWWHPIFASPKDHAGQEQGKKELWSMIFEKAWAKLHLSYEATAGGQTGDTTNYLSGGTIREIDLQPNIEDADDQWEDLRTACLPGSFCFLSCSLRPGAGEEGAKMGLIDGHAYSILGMKKVSNGERLIQVRNPWGESEWKGRYSDGAPEWTDALKAEVGAKDQEDGSFWMPWDDFLMYFGSVDVCDPTTLKKLSEDHKCRIDVYAGHWIRGVNAGGDSDTASFKCNPILEMKTKADGVVEFSMYQPDVRPLLQLTDENVGGNPTMMKLFLVDPETEEVTEILTSQRRVQCNKVTVKGNKIYHVIPTAWAPGVEGAFWVTASGCGCEFKTLPGLEPSPEQRDVMAKEHPRDLCCVGCHGELAMFYGSSLGPMCESCHENQKPRCFNCNETVSGSYFPDVKGLGPCCMKCKDIVDPPLVCSKCKAPIEGSYYPLDDGPVCVTCGP